MNDEIVCLVCGCRVTPYRDVEGYVSITSALYRKYGHRWFCPLCDAEIEI